MAVAQRINDGLCLLLPPAALAGLLLLFAPALAYPLLVLIGWLGVLCLLAPSWVAPVRQYFAVLLDPPASVIAGIGLVLAYVFIVTPRGMAQRISGHKRLPAGGMADSYWTVPGGRRP